MGGIQEDSAIMLPKDPFILLSTVNMKLRDHHSSFEEYCLSENHNSEEIIDTLAKVNYHYDKDSNQFK